MKLLAGVLSMALTIALSNFLVQFPVGGELGKWLTYAGFTYPLVFLIEDIANRLGGVAMARKIVFLGFLFGILLSFSSAPLRIVIASGSAFLVGGLCNVFLFNRLRHLTWWKAPLISTMIASIVDSLLFFSLAFWGTEHSWIHFALGDLTIKLLLAICFLPMYRILLSAATSAWMHKKEV